MKDVTKTNRDVELALCVQETQASVVQAEGLRNEAGWTALSPVWKLLHCMACVGLREIVDTSQQSPHLAVS